MERFVVRLALVALLLAVPIQATAQIGIGFTRDRWLQEVSALPAPPVNLQVSEALASPDTPPVTHSHDMGWGYAAEGTHIVIIDGRTQVYGSPLGGPRAFWIPAGIEHTHEWSGLRQSRVLFAAIGTSLPPEAPSGFRTLALTGPLQPLSSGGAHSIVFAHLSVGSLPANFTAVQFVDDLPGVLVGLEGALKYQDRIVPGPGAETRILRRGEVIVLPPRETSLWNVPNESGSALVMHLFPKR